MKKVYRVLSAELARGLGVEVGATYEKDYHPSLEHAVLAAGHAEVVVKGSRSAGAPASGKSEKEQ